MAEARILQQGTLEAFTTNPPTAAQLQWAQPASDDKINGVIIPLGYAAEELADPAFQAEYAKITQRFFADFPKSHFNLTLYTGKEPDLAVLTYDKMTLVKTSA